MGEGEIEHVNPAVSRLEFLRWGTGGESRLIPVGVGSVEGR